jgi:hypothetical protein
MLGAGEKFHLDGKAFLDIWLIAVSIIQLKRWGNHLDIKVWKKKKLRVWVWSNVAWLGVYRGN